MWKLKGAICAITAAALLSGCASIVSDDDTKTRVATNPESARCDLTGKGFQLAINSPSTVILPSRAAPITVACQADGYKTTTAELDTSVDGWIFGNIILGGVIGAVIDGVRGAGMKYPEEIHVTLEPESFPTVSARDDFYDSRRADAEQKWDEIVQKITTQCSTRSDLESADCEMRLERAKGKREEEIAAIEESRSGAIIVSAEAETMPESET